METEQDKELWKIAKKRVSFKRHLASYLIINAMFWFIWYFSEKEEKHSEFPWPVWPMLGWGIGLSFDYLGTYVFVKNDAVKKEYEKLKNK